MKNKGMVLLVGLFVALAVNAQVELPSMVNCNIQSKDRITFCIDADTYKINWTAALFFANDIEEKKFLPPDSEFFRDMPQQLLKDWEIIEKQVRYWSVEFDSIYVVTGRTRLKFDSIETTAFYKAVLKGCQGDAIGFLVAENQLAKNLNDFTVTIDSLENLTNMDFFPTLNVDLQDIIESSYNPDYWPITDFESF